MRNIRIAAIAFVALLSAFSLEARFNIDVTLSRRVYMQYEPIYACVTVRNDTGRAILFGEDPRLQGFILFDIRGPNGKPVKKRPGREISVTGLLLQSGEIKNMVIPISRYYDMDTPGNYKVAAFISHNLVNEEYQSEFKYISVETGVEYWSRTVGVPNLDEKSSDTVKQRTYSVRTLREATSSYYYLVVEDEKKVYGVMRIGQVVGREVPKMETDMLSRIHLLMPMSPRVFHYLSFSVDGININNSYWKTEETIPMLWRDPATGKVTRIGGSPARPGTDFRDPNEGKLTASRIVDETGHLQRQTQVQTPPADEGIIDIGKKLDFQVKDNL
ncbi:MAG: hypothetical protein MJ025_00675 [Victivallaceae bacterium]|nr:hypothetical protein [Victivallaceae bacterium]